jgi:hypothetical protein
MSNGMDIWPPICGVTSGLGLAHLGVWFGTPRVGLGTTLRQEVLRHDTPNMSVFLAVQKCESQLLTYWQLNHQAGGYTIPCSEQDFGKIFLIRYKKF